MNIDIFSLIGGIIGGSLVFFLFFFFKKAPKPAFGYSSLQLFPSVSPTKYSPAVFYGLAGLCFILALSNFRLMESASLDEGRKPLFHEGIAIYLVLDQSGSMKTDIVINDERFVSKINLLKEVTQEFIQARKGDLLGLIAFARKGDLLSPLTSDHEHVLKELQKLDVVKDKQHDGTAIGYAIAKASTLIEATRQFAKEDPSYQLKGAAIVLVTDGFQVPHPEDKGNPLRTMGILEAADGAKKSGAHLYIVSIDPLIDGEEYAPQRRIMQKAAEETGGAFFGVSDPSTLSSIYKKIDQLEPSQISTEPDEKEERVRVRFYFFFVLGGLFLLAWGCLKETLFFRSLP